MVYFLAFFVSLIISFVFTPLTVLFFKKQKWLDDPAKQSLTKTTHRYPVSRGGGLPIFLSLLSCLFFLPLDQHLKGILAAVLVALLVGLADDIFREKIPPLPRLAANFLSAGLVVFAGIGIAFINNPLGGIIQLDTPQFCFNFLGQTRCLWILADLLALIWIVWCMNFVGWSGGVEGQLPGIVGLAGLTIAGLSLKFSADITQWPITILALILSGAYFGFLPWNFYPQKIMPGYSGKTIAGLMLAILSILSTAKMATLMLVMAIPLIDASYLVIKRILSGKSPVWGSREHFHHRLLDLGWSKKKIALFYWSITFLLGILALNLNSKQKLYTMLMLLLLFFGTILWIKFFSTFSNQPDQDNG